MPKDDGSGWMIWVWWPAGADGIMDGVDEGDLEAAPPDLGLIDQAPVGPDLGLPWRDMLVFGLGTTIWDRDEAGEKFEQIFAAISGYLSGMDVELEIPERFDEPYVAWMRAHARRDAAEELRDLLSDASFGRWTVEEDDGWAAALLWHPPTLAGLEDTKWITMMDVEVLPWEHPGKRSWRFADAIR
jgi:hypothetical protein